MVLGRSKRTKKLRNKRKSKTARRKMRGGDIVKFNKEIFDSFLNYVNDNLPSRIGGLELDNVGLEENDTVITLAGRGAGGPMDSCKFTINPTGQIQFIVTYTETEELGNAWEEKKDEYLDNLSHLVNKN